MEPGEYFDTGSNQWGGVHRLLSVALAAALTCLLWHYLTARASVDNTDPATETTMDDSYEVLACSGGYANPVYEDQMTLDDVPLTTEDHQLLLMYVQSACSSDVSEPKYTYLETIAEESSDDLRSDESRSDASGRWGWDCSSTDGAPSVIHVPCQQAAVSDKLNDEIQLVRSMSKEEELDKWLEESIREMEVVDEQSVSTGDEQWSDLNNSATECCTTTSNSCREGRSNDGLSVECSPEAQRGLCGSPPCHGHLARRQPVAMETDKRTPVGYKKEETPTNNLLENEHYVQRMNTNNSRGPREIVEELRMSNSDLLILFENEEGVADNVNIAENYLNSSSNNSYKEDFSEWNNAIDEYLFSLVSWSNDGATSRGDFFTNPRTHDTSNRTFLQRSSSLDDIWKQSDRNGFDVDFARSDEKLYNNSEFKKCHKHNDFDSLTFSTKGIFNQQLSDKSEREGSNSVISGLSEGRHVDNFNSSVGESVRERHEQNNLCATAGNVLSNNVVNCDRCVVPSGYDKSVTVCDITQDWSDSSSDDEPRTIRARRGVCENLTLIDSDSSESETSSSDGQYECFNGHVICDAALVRSLSLNELRAFSSCETLHRLTSLAECPRERHRDGESCQTVTPTRPSTENLSEDSGYCDTVTNDINTKSDKYSDDILKSKAPVSDLVLKERQFTIGVIFEEDNESYDAMTSNKTISARARLEQLLLRDHERRARAYTDAHLSDSREEVKNILKKTDPLIKDQFPINSMGFNEMDSISSLSLGGGSKSESWQEELLEQEWERAVVSGRAATDDWFSVKKPRASRGLLKRSRSFDCLPNDVTKKDETSKVQKNDETNRREVEVLSAPASMITPYVRSEVVGDKHSLVDKLKNESLEREAEELFTIDAKLSNGLENIVTARLFIEEENDLVISEEGDEDKRMDENKRKIEETKIIKNKDDVKIEAGDFSLNINDVNLNKDCVCETLVVDEEKAINVEINNNKQEETLNQQLDEECLIKSNIFVDIINNETVDGISSENLLNDRGEKGVQVERSGSVVYDEQLNGAVECRKREESFASGIDDKGPYGNLIVTKEALSPNWDSAFLLEGTERPRSTGPDLAESQGNHAGSLGGVSAKGNEIAATTSKSTPDLRPESTKYGRELSRRMARPNIRLSPEDHEESPDDRMLSWNSPRHVSRTTIPTIPYVSPDGLITQPRSQSPAMSSPTSPSSPVEEGSPSKEPIQRVHVVVVPDTCTPRSMKGLRPHRSPPPPPPPLHSSKSDATCDVASESPLPSNSEHDDHRDVNRMESVSPVINGDPASRALEDSFRQLERAISSLEQDIVEQQTSSGFYLHPPPKPTPSRVAPPPPPVVPSRARIIHARNQFFTPTTTPSPTSPETAGDAFDKFRQKAQDGKERVARSVVDLEEIERLVRQEVDRNAVATLVSINKEGTSTERHHERKKDRPSNGSRSRSVGYLETNLDTLDTRVEYPRPGEAFTNAGDVRQKTAPRVGVLASAAKAVSMLSLRRETHQNEEADRARSMEFLLDAENKAAAQPPENALMMHGNDEGDGSEQRTLSQHELRVRHSLQRLDIPEWFKNSPYSKSDSTGFLRKKRDSSSESTGSQEQLRWQGLASSRTPSASSLASTPAPPTPSPSVPSLPSRPRAATAMTRVPPPYCWRYPRLSRESLQSPGSPSPSPQERGQFQFPRWSSSSTSPSPTGSLQRSLITRQPYLGWRSSERLNRDVASANSTPTHFYRSAAERLSCGPGYYALRFGGTAKPGSEGNLLSVRQSASKTKRSPVSPYATKPPIPPKPTVSPTSGLYRQSTQVISNGYSSEKDISSASSSMPARDLSTASLEPLDNTASPTQSVRSESPKSPSPRQRVVWMESSFVGVKPNQAPPRQPPSTITPPPHRGGATSPSSQDPKSRHGSGSSSSDESRVTKAKRSFTHIHGEDGQEVRDRSSSVAALEEVLDSLLAIPSSSSRSVSPNLAASSGARTRFYCGDDSDSDTRGTPVGTSRSPSRRSSGHEPTPASRPPSQSDEDRPSTHLVYGREGAASGRQPADAPRTLTNTLSTSSTADETLEAANLPCMPAPLGDPPLRGGASFDLPYDSDEFHDERLSLTDENPLDFEPSPPERRGSHPRPPTPPPRPLAAAIQPEADGKESATAPSSQMHVHWGEIPKVEAGAPVPPSREDVLRRRGSEQLRNLLPDDLLVRCSFPRCAKSVEWAEARRSFKTCHNCYTYYCSRECRRLHWDKHRRTCMYSRIRSLCKHVVLRTRDDIAVQAHLSKLARTGVLTQGRGFIKLVFRNPELVERFLRQGWQALEDNPMYVAWRDLLPQELGAEVFQEVTDMCKQYNPEVKFILLAAVYVTREIPAQPVPRWEREVIAKCAKVPLRKPGGPSGDDYGDTTLEPDTLILTAVPHLASTLSPEKARELCFSNIQKHLRMRGVSLQHQYPEVFEKLTAYVEKNEIFTPITIYPKDVRNGKTFMCLIMPNTEPEIESMVNDFSRK